VGPPQRNERGAKTDLQWNLDAADFTNRGQDPADGHGRGPDAHGGLSARSFDVAEVREQDLALVAAMSSE